MYNSVSSSVLHVVASSGINIEQDLTNEDKNISNLIETLYEEKKEKIETSG